MKKIISIIAIIFLIVFICQPIYANSKEKYTLSLTVKENTEDLQIFILLPEKYIKFLMERNNIDYDEQYTLVDIIKGEQLKEIQVDMENVQDKIYIENNIKYVQILLETIQKNVYNFDIVSDYTNMDIKYRVKSNTEDYIMHIDNFKIKDGVCKIEYNATKNTIKQPDEIIITLPTIIFLCLIVIIIIIIIYKWRNR